MSEPVQLTKINPPRVLNLNGSCVTLKALAVVGEMLEEDGCVLVVGTQIPELMPRRRADDFEHEMRMLDRQPNPREDHIRRLAAVAEVGLYEWDERVLFPLYEPMGFLSSRAAAFLIQRCSNAPRGCRIAGGVPLSIERAVEYACGCRVSPCVIPMEAPEELEAKAFRSALDALNEPLIQEK